MQRYLDLLGVAMRLRNDHPSFMAHRFFFLVQVAAVLGSGVIAGVFFAFSSFVMPALSRLPAAQGIAAMQSVNVVVLNRSFLGVFLGTGGLCALLALRALTRWSAPGAKLELCGSALYLLGCLLVTGAGNIPWNHALSRLVPESEAALAIWGRFVTEWSRWNHIRAGASLAAAALLVLSLAGGGRWAVVRDGIAGLR